MQGLPSQTNVTPLSALSGRFRANVEALRTRDPELARRLINIVPDRVYGIVSDADSVRLAELTPEGARLLPHPVPPGSVAGIVQQLTSNQQVSGPLLVAGIDHGWLWDALSKLDIKTPTAPGHRMPIFLLANDLERLWAVLHLHDWRPLLADRRAIILGGGDVAAQFRQLLIDHPEIAFPRTCITVDPNAWPAGESFDETLATANQAVHRLTAAVDERLRATAERAPPNVALAEAFASGRPLRILGMTSLYTTFLQHSMRDWLAGMESLGHTTKLLIEQFDHEKPHPLTYLTAIEAFAPDLIVMIDHFRAELPLMPPHIPFVMWVQDRLPNIFCAKAGAAQGELDFVIGYGRGECVNTLGYPRQRFMEAVVGVNDARFKPTARRATGDDACEVAFVSHASTSPEQLVAEQIERLGNTGEAKRLFHGLLDRLQAVYSSGTAVTAAHELRAIVDAAIQSSRVDVPDVRPLVDFVTHKLNNALLRHQTISWAVETGVDLHLYGRQWDLHPKFSRYARGVAENESRLADIYRSAKINLQVTPHGSAHQRTFEGLCAGGFFLLRHVTGDTVERIYQRVWMWTREHGIESDVELLRRATPEVHQWLSEIAQLRGGMGLADSGNLVDMLASLHRSGFTRSAGTMFAEFDQVSFTSREEFQSKLKLFLSDAVLRNEIAGSMRQKVLDSVTYSGISRRMLSFIASQLRTHDGGIPKLIAA